MKKWPFVVAGLYGLALLAVSGPLCLIAFFPRVHIGDLHFVWPQTAVVIAVMVLAQFALLRVPVFAATRRPISRRPLRTTIIAAAFAMGLLAAGSMASIYEFSRGADVLTDSALLQLLLTVAVGLCSWVWWALYFHRATTARPDEATGKMQRIVLRGSVLELLIAVPTHIVARHRDYCCAGLLTFVGLVCGISVMLFAFGPAVYVLFVRRWQRLHPNYDAT